MLLRKAIKLKAQQVQWGCVTCNNWSANPYGFPAWEDNVAEWIEEMKQEWQHDVAVLKAWVASVEKEYWLYRGARILRQHQGNWLWVTIVAGQLEFYMHAVKIANLKEFVT